MDGELIDRYVEATEVTKRLANALDEHKTQCARLEREVENALLAEGLSSVTRGGATVSLRRSVFPAFPRGKQAVIDMLMASGEYADIVQMDVATATVGKLLREREGDYPPEWAGILEEALVYRVRVHTAG